MDIGVGLPSTIPAATGADVLTWAREGDDAGFASLGTLDRVIYGNHEPLVTLAAAAAVTSRARLTTSILITPYRGNGTLLAKQLASVDSYAGGRLVVGLGSGGWEDDYAATGVDFGGRGAALDAQLAEFAAVWGGEPRGIAGAVGPAPAQAGGPPLLIGGMSKVVFGRMVSHGAGWISGGGGAAAFSQGAERARTAWTQGGRPGAPRLAALTYFALGPDATTVAEDYVHAYYGSSEYAASTAASALTSASAVRDAIAAFADAGCDEVIFFPCSPEIDQLRRLADTTFG